MSAGADAPPEGRQAGPLFERDGDLFLPTPATAGPWDPGALHGGAAAALLVAALEQVDPDPEMPFARLTFEFTRPVPLAPLGVAATLVRPGRRVQRLEAEIRSGEQVVARATGLRIRMADAEVPAGKVPSPAPMPAPGASTSPKWLQRWDSTLLSWMEVRVAEGEFLERGPGSAWFRAPGAFVAGIAPSPVQRVVAAADFGNGLSGVLDFRTHLYINPDLTVYLHRYPRGEWVGLEAQTWVHAHGVGLAESLLWDEEGPIGRSLQALLVGKRA